MRERFYKKRSVAAPVFNTEIEKMSEFDDIRPYNDSELVSVFQRIVDDDECIDLVGKLRFPKTYRYFGWLLRPLLRKLLAANVSKIKTVNDFQLIVKKYLEKMVKTTTASFQVAGLDRLSFDRPYLFMSNHRDITLDPAFTNYALHLHGKNTLRIAIGDNLLSKPFAADLMRLNKSFIVRRSIKKPRELLRSLNLLSRYIKHSIDVDGEHVWIAHREGRAKDGIDQTDPAIIKMLTIAKPKDVLLSDYIKELNIVPVSISYEYDPCDAMKARELKVVRSGGNYVKSEHEDLESIGLGISGYKGNIALVFGEPLQGSYSTVDDVAAELDRTIASNYRLHKTNLIAYKMLCGDDAYAKLCEQLSSHDVIAKDKIDRDTEEEFTQRLLQSPEDERVFVLEMYANPVHRFLQFSGIA